MIVFQITATCALNPNHDENIHCIIKGHLGKG